MNDDLYPEIITVGNYGMHMFSHQGEKIWGPLLSKTPFDTFWWSPVIANVDHDHLPEIIVEHKAVKADGSILWSNVRNGQYYINHPEHTQHPTKEAMAFDFNADGRYEVFSRSFTEVSILNGSTGVELVGLESSGFGLNYYPIIADLDHDGSAEVINLETSPWGSYGGVTVWEDANGGWADTRGIWNQNRYFISNINDDGTIPRNEEPSWKTHNTFRVNPSYNPVKADITLSLFELFDNGIGQPYTLGIRIGNGGNVPIEEDLNITFYDGNPDIGGILLGSLVVPSLLPNAHLDLTFEGIEQLVDGEVYAIADEAGLIQEYSEANNRISIPVVSGNVPATIEASTDALTYGVNSDVNLTAVVTNPGRLSYALSVQLKVIDGCSGVTVETFPTVDLGVLASGELRTLSQMWNTSTLLSGPYQLRAVLLDSEGAMVDESTAGFSIVSDSGLTELASLSVETDRALYHTTDTVSVENFIRNLSLNSILSGASLELTIESIDTNTTLTQRTLALNDFAPESMRTLFESFELVKTSEGAYRVTGEMLATSGELLATDSALFEVRSDLTKALIGQVSVELPVLEQGDMQSCTDSLFNNGTAALSGQPLRQLLVNLDTNVSITQDDLSLSLETNSSTSFERAFDTMPLNPGGYACVLQAMNEGEWLTLGFAGFTLKEPPIRIAYEMSSGSKGRLLIMMDEGDAEPFRPDTVPSPNEQRLYLEALLDTNGYAYTIVTDATAFTNAFRSGAYNAYAILSEVPKLSEQVQDEMAEAVFRGEGLFIAGKHDQRNGRLDEIAGVFYKGKNDKADSFDHNATTYMLEFKDDKLRVRVEEADVMSSFNDSGYPAIVTSTYYTGKTAFAAFDLLVYSTAVQGAYESLLLELLSSIQNESFAQQTYSVLPITLQLTNLGIPVEGESVTLYYGVNTEVVDAGKGYIAPDASLHWEYSLLESNSTALDFWLWPKESGVLELENTLYVLRNGESMLYEAFTHSFDIAAGITVEEVLAQVEAENDKGYRQVETMLQRAQSEIARNRLSQAMGFALNAAAMLERDNTARSNELRYALAHAIKALAMSMDTTTNTTPGRR